MQHSNQYPNALITVGVGSEYVWLIIKELVRPVLRLLRLGWYEKFAPQLAEDDFGSAEFGPVSHNRSVEKR